MTVRPRWLRAAAYRTFYRMPRRVRAQLVRRLTPNYTVGAVVLLRDSERRLLLVRQPHAQGWSLPGGLADWNEAPVQTAARELLEEVGVRLAATELKPADPSARVSPVSQQVDMIFTATIPSPSTSIVLRADPAEIADVGWYSPDALPPLTPPTQALLRLCAIAPPVP